MSSLSIEFSVNIPQVIYLSDWNTGSDWSKRVHPIVTFEFISEMSHSPVLTLSGIINVTSRQKYIDLTGQRWEKTYFIVFRITRKRQTRIHFMNLKN